MPVLHFTTQINGSDETIFALIADLTQYDRWLPHSNAFGAVTKISPVPVGLGTTYVDKGPTGTMRGSVVDYHPPTHIAFQQFMPVKLLLLTGMLDLHIRYTLEPAGQGTQVNRDVTFDLPGVLKMVQPIIAVTIRQESQRILLLMKQYVEAQHE